MHTRYQHCLFTSRSSKLMKGFIRKLALATLIKHEATNCISALLTLYIYCHLACSKGFQSSRRSLQRILGSWCGAKVLLNESEFKGFLR